MDNKQLKIIKESKVKQYYNNIHKSTKQDDILTEMLDIKSKRAQGKKLTRQRKKRSSTLTKKK
jgi:hypothetical protein